MGVDYDGSGEAKRGIDQAEISSALLRIAHEYAKKIK